MGDFNITITIILCAMDRSSIMSVITNHYIIVFVMLSYSLVTRF